MLNQVEQIKITVAENYLTRHTVLFVDFKLILVQLTLNAINQTLFDGYLSLLERARRAVCRDDLLATPCIAPIRLIKIGGSQL